MINETLARRYATAVFSLAKEANAIDGVGKALARMGEIIASDETIRRYYSAPIVDRTDKTNALAAAFEGKVHEIALHTLLLLVRKRREALLWAIAEQYEVLALAERSTEKLRITSALALSEQQVASVLARLESHYGKKFDVEQRVDPRVIGGIQITMGDRNVDGTIAGRLSELSRTLFN